MTKVYRIEKLGCANCAAKMERAINKIKGVNSASINFMTKKLTIEAKDDMFDDIIAEAAKKAGKIEKGIAFEEA